MGLPFRDSGMFRNVINARSYRFLSFKLNLLLKVKTERSISERLESQGKNNHRPNQFLALTGPTG